ncbi:MAG TPA: hypothetical protein VFX92_09060 [Candidatus Krumholzibacteria bacterium]|nr:hypothetical protein [Candidatus Krumholzibacteria bacterium]
MHELQVWHIVAANVLAFLIYLAIRRWSRSFGIGLVGLVLTILPGAFAYFTGRTSLVEALGPVLGVLIVAADLTGRVSLKRRPAGQPRG